MALHQPLLHNHIRLLHLLPGQGRQAICARLVEVSLSYPPPYEALSYTWGSAEQRSSIFCNGHNLPVTDNLWGALRNLRHPMEERVLWIDAVCINQLDTQEQTKQVRMMDAIYRLAFHVLIWLGEETPSDQEAFAILENFRTEFLKRGRFNFSGFDFDRGFPPRDDDGWVALANLFQRPWFYRVWVIQEAAVARDATIFCGQLRASWHLIADVCASLAEIGGVGGYDALDVAPGVLAVPVLQSFRAEKDIPLLTCLRLTRSFRATDARDHVFALMGLTSDNKAQGGYIDYDMDQAQLFFLLAQEYLVHRQTLEYLSQGGLYSTSPNWTLPSWVVDWSHDNDHRCTLGAYQAPFRFSASGTTSPVVSISPDGKILNIRGYLIDSIACLDPFIRKVFDVAPLEKGQEPWEQHAREFRLLEKKQMRGLDNITRQPFFIPDGQTREEAIWRNFCCDMTPSSRRTESESVISYQWYRRILDMTDENGDVDEVQYQSDEWMQRVLLVYGPNLNGAKLYNIARHCCSTLSGYIGSVPKGSAVRDVICLFSGASVPFVLRECGDGTYQLIGECYIHGVMDGEVLEWDHIESLVRDFKIR